MPVTVVGPDKKQYSFPDGTTKDQAISYFKKKGIGAAPTPAATPTPAAAAATPSQYAKPGYKITTLDPNEERAFQDWVKNNRIPSSTVTGRPDPTFTAADNDYDMRGYWKALQAGDARAKQAEANQHFPDIWKTPYHQSFSRESMYATPDAPYWMGHKLIDKNGAVVYEDKEAEEAEQRKTQQAAMTSAPPPVTPTGELPAEMQWNPKPVPAEFDAAPVNAKYPRLGRGGYDLVDFLAGLTPPAFEYGTQVLAAPLAVGGTVAAAPFLGPISPAAGVGIEMGAGALGGATGNRAQRFIEELMYKDLPPETIGDIAKGTGKEALIGAFTAGQGKAVDLLTENAVRNARLVRELARQGREGTPLVGWAPRWRQGFAGGVGADQDLNRFRFQFTPGETLGSTSLKSAEGITSHLTGGSGVMEDFREVQAAQINKAAEEQLNAISKRKDLTPEEAGLEIQQVYTQAKEQLPEVKPAITQVENERLNNIDTVARTQLQTLNPVEVPKEQVGRSTQIVLGGKQEAFEGTKNRDLEALSQRQQADINNTFSAERDALHPIANTPDQSGAAIRSHLQTRQDAIEAESTTKVDQVRANQQTNVNQILNQEAQALSPRQQDSEHVGLKAQGLLKQDHGQSEATVAAKYMEVRQKLAETETDPAKKARLLAPDVRIPNNELDAMAEKVPEAQSLRKEADLLYMQEKARFDVPIIDKLIKAPPEDIASILRNASLDDLRELKKYLPLEARQDVARELWESMVHTATKRGAVSADSLANQLKALGATPADAAAHGREIFGDRYDSLVKAADKIDAENAAADLKVDGLNAQAKPSKLTQDILKASPEQVVQLMMTANNDQLTALKEIIPPDMWNAASRNILDSVLAPPPGGIVTEKSLAAAMYKLGPRASIIFGDRFSPIGEAIGKFGQINRAAEASAAQVEARASDFDRDLYQKILKPNQAPEKVAELLETAKYDDLRKLMQDPAIPEDLKRELRRNVYENLLGPRDPVTEQYRARNFARNLENLDPERGRIIFGDQYESVVRSGADFDRFNAAAKVRRDDILKPGKTINSKLVQKIVKMNDPQMVGGILLEAGPAELRAALEQMPAETRELARRQALESYFTPSRDIETGDIDPFKLSKTLEARLNKLGKTRGRILFGDQYDNIVEFTKDLKRIGFAENPLQGRMHMMTSMSAIFGGAAAGFGLGKYFGAGFLPGLEGAAEGAMTMYMLPKITAWLLTSPRFSDFAVTQMRRAVGIIIRGGEPMFIDQQLRNLSSPAIYPPPPPLPNDPDQIGATQ